MNTSDVIALLALVVSILSIVFTWCGVLKTNDANIKIFKRSNIIDLHHAWRGVNKIDVDNVIAVDVMNAINALDLTASLWNHDVIEKSVLHQSYWPPFKELYDTMRYCQNEVPGYGKMSTLIKENIDVAYRQMAEFGTPQTKIQ